MKVVFQDLMFISSLESMAKLDVGGRGRIFSLDPSLYQTI